MADALAKELETYTRMLPTLAGDEGKFALIRGDELVKVFDTYRDALSAGYERFGLAPFLVKQISSTQLVSYFSRDLRFDAAPDCADHRVGPAA